MENKWMRITNDSRSFGHVTYLNLLSDEGSSCEGVSVASITSVVSSTCSASASIWKTLVLFKCTARFDACQSYIIAFSAANTMNTQHLPTPLTQIQIGNDVQDVKRQCQMFDGFPLALKPHDELNMPEPPSSDGLLGYKQLIWATGISGHKPCINSVNAHGQLYNETSLQNIQNILQMETMHERKHFEILRENRSFYQLVIDLVKFQEFEAGHFKYIYGLIRLNLHPELLPDIIRRRGFSKKRAFIG